MSASLADSRTCYNLFVLMAKDPAVPVEHTSSGAFAASGDSYCNDTCEELIFINYLEELFWEFRPDAIGDLLGNLTFFGSSLLHFFLGLSDSFFFTLESDKLKLGLSSVILDLRLSDSFYWEAVKLESVCNLELVDDDEVNEDLEPDCCESFELELMSFNIELSTVPSMSSILVLLMAR